MAEQKRPGAVQSARAGEKVFFETYPHTTLPIASQTETMTRYHIDHWSIVSAKWVTRNG